MKKLAAQQVQREKEEGQKRLEEALVKAREEFVIEKAEAVQLTREEERGIAAEETKRVAQTEEDKRKQLILAAEKEKQVMSLMLFKMKIPRLSKQIGLAQNIGKLTVLEKSVKLKCSEILRDA